MLYRAGFATAAAAALAFAPMTAQAQNCGTIELGAALSATGIYASNGNNTRNGYEFAVKKINDAGGVTIGGKCYHFKIKYYDDESTPARAAQLIERLIDQDHIQYILGPYSSPLAKAVLPVTEKYKTPIVQGEAASRSLFTQGYKYHFGIVATSEKYLTPVVDMAAEMGGNVEGTEPGKEVVKHGVRIIGRINLASGVPYHASQMYARNITSFIVHILKDGKLRLDRGDEIIRETLLTSGGEVVNDRVREFFSLPATVS